MPLYARKLGWMLVFVLLVETASFTYRAGWERGRLTPMSVTPLSVIPAPVLVEVAEVYGRAPGCRDAPYPLVALTAQAALRQGLPPRLLAALVATESACNPLAVSSRGAVGLTQVHVVSWSASMDFEHQNLFNSAVNLRLGASILGGLVARYGVEQGLRRYNGLGVGCDTCDGSYTYKILSQFQSRELRVKSPVPAVKKIAVPVKQILPLPSEP